MEIYFNMNKIKYSIMIDMFNNYGLDAKKPVNLFINLNPIMGLLTMPSSIEYLKIKPNVKYIEFMSCVLNMAAHYKHFFIKNGIPIKVYMYAQYPFNSNTQMNRDYNSEYRMYTEYKFTNESVLPLNNIIDNTFSNIKAISSYINDVYVIDSNNIESSLIPKILYDPERTNIILTNDLYDFQYVNHDFKLIIPKNNKSVILDDKNVMGYIKHKERIEKDILVGSNLLPFIISIYGNKYRNIYKIKGFGMRTILNALDKAITENIITPKTDNIDLLLPIIKPQNRDMVKYNFYCTDINHQYERLSIVDIDMIKNQIIDKYDPESLNDINNRFFELYPLQLIELTSKIVSKKPIKF